MATVIKAGEPARAVRPARVDLKDHMAQTRRLLDQAEVQAAAIIARAKEQAFQEAALAKEEAAQAGYAEGYAKGLAEGRETGTQAGFADAFTQSRNQFREEHGALIADLSRLMEVLQSDREALEIAARHDVLAFAVKLAQKLTFAIGLQFSESVTANLERAIRLIRDKNRLVVRANSSDLEILRTFAVSILDLAARSDAIRFEADDSIAPGGCTVSTDRTEVDARLETQIDELVLLILGSPQPHAGRAATASPKEPVLKQDAAVAEGANG